jgi:acyl carrier protein
MMEELIKYLSEKLKVDASEISPTSHLIDDLDSDDWTNLEVIIEVGDKWNRPITNEEASTIETVQDIFDIINN